MPLVVTGEKGRGYAAELWDLKAIQGFGAELSEIAVRNNVGGLPCGNRIGEHGIAFLGLRSVAN